MNGSDFDNLAADLLPCECGFLKTKSHHTSGACPSYRRPAVAAALRDAYVSGARASERNLHHCTLGR